MRKNLILSLCGFVVLAFIFFGNGIKGDFVYDDQWAIKLNPTLNDLSKIPNQFILPYHYQQPGTGLYRPLTLISYSLNLGLSKGPAGFHIINILLHALNSFLIFWLILKVFGSRRLAFFTSLLFLFLPIHVEAVTSISGRSDLLALSFSLASLLAMVYRRYLWSVLAFLLALWSKESALALIPIIFFWFWYFEKIDFRSSLKKLLYYMPGFAVYAIMRFFALKGDLFKNDASYIYNPLKFLDPVSRFFTALKVMTLYLWKSIFPYNLSADYSFDQIKIVHNFFNFYVIAGSVVLFFLVFIAFSRKIKNQELQLGSAIFIFSYFIVSNFIIPVGTIMAERAFYLPSLGIALILSSVFYKLSVWKFKNFWVVVFVIVCFGYGLIILERNRAWLNEEVLFKDMILKSPSSAHAKTNLGIYYIKNGQWDKGRGLLEKSFLIYTGSPPNLNSLGIVAEHEKRYQDAERFYLKAIEISPGYPTATANLNRLYAKFGKKY